MTDQLTDPLTDVVGRFVAAESALDALRIRQTELRDATAQLRDAASDMGESTTRSVAALEDVRSDLRRRFEEEEARAVRQEAIDTEVAQVLAEMRLVLEQLRAIDPARVAHDLSEIRRDGADNASELREVRRLTDSVERAQGQISRDLESRWTATGTAIADLGSAVDERFAELGSSDDDALARLQDLDRTHRRSAGRRDRRRLLVGRL
jgi:chromosome segregation ATPase